MKNLNNKENYIFACIFLTLIAILCFLGVYGGIKNQNIDLLKTEKISGLVEFSETKTETRANNRHSTNFYIKLVGINKKLGVGRVTENYNDLIETIKNGDLLTLYYEEVGNENSIIEIHRKSEILLFKSEYENRSNIVAVVSLIGFICCIYGIYEVRKKNLENKISGRKL